MNLQCLKVEAQIVIDPFSNQAEQPQCKPVLGQFDQTCIIHKGQKRREKKTGEK